jgi:hypothetical protein
MNEQIKKLIMESINFRLDPDSNAYEAQVCPEDLEYLAELIVEECRTVIVELYRKTSLELCGPLLTADEKIAEHFYGVEE